MRISVIAVGTKMPAWINAGIDKIEWIDPLQSEEPKARTGPRDDRQRAFNHGKV